MLSKPGSIRLIEAVPFQNMPTLHPDEEVSKGNEFGPLLNDDICITTEIHLSNQFRFRAKINTAVRELISIHLETSRLKSDQGGF